MTANPNQGWRIAPAPGAVLRRTQSGRFALDMEITHDGEHKTTIEYVYTGQEIESLFGQMRRLYAEGAMVPPLEDRRALAAEMGQWQ